MDSAHYLISFLNALVILFNIIDLVVKICLGIFITVLETFFILRIWFSLGTKYSFQIFISNVKLIMS